MAITTQPQEVTREQLDRCQRWERNGKVFYQVTSESDPTGEGWYKVEWNERYRCLSCNCKAGREGIACKHLRWVRAAEQEYKAERRRLSLACQAEAERTALVQREMLEATIRQAEARLAELHAEPELSEEEKTIARLVAQGVDRATAFRVATAKPQKGSGKGTLLNSGRSFSLMA